MTTRNKLYGVINMAKNQFGMDEDSYRAMIKRISGHDSLKSCSYEHLNKIIDEMVGKGFELKDKPKTPKATSPILSEVKSLWYELHELGAIDDNSDSALSKFCHKYTSIDSWRWNSVSALLSAAFSMAVLGAIESLLCAVILDNMTCTKHNPNSELIGQGLISVQTTKI